MLLFLKFWYHWSDFGFKPTRKITILCSPKIFFTTVWIIIMLPSVDWLSTPRTFLLAQRNSYKDNGMQTSTTIPRVYCLWNIWGIILTSSGKDLVWSDLFFSVYRQEMKVCGHSNMKKKPTLCQNRSVYPASMVPVCLVLVVLILDIWDGLFRLDGEEHSTKLCF